MARRAPRPPSSVPPALLATLRCRLPGSDEEILARLAGPRPVVFRLNTLHPRALAVPDELAAAGLGLQPLPWCRPPAFRLVEGDLRALQETEAARTGALYVQGVSSLLAAPALGPRPGEAVCDLAAAPGSKTTHSACLMEATGRLLANERSRARTYKLRAVLQQQHAERFVEVSCRPGELLPRTHAGAFDRVLLDAPCSGDGRLRSDDARTYAGFSRARSRRLAALQVRLLQAALQLVRPGGTVLYTTCTLAPEEDELVLDRVLRRRDDGTRLLPLHLPDLPGVQSALPAWNDRPLHEDLPLARLVLPDGTRDGFFLAALRRGDGPVR